MLRQAVCCLAALLLTGCGTINSTITIEQGERFVLGGNQDDGFRLELRNVGQGPVEIATRTENEEIVVLGVLDAGDEQTLQIPRRTAAIILNASEVAAQVAAKILGGGTLGMGYERKD